MLFHVVGLMSATTAATSVPTTAATSISTTAAITTTVIFPIAAVTTAITATVISAIVGAATIVALSILVTLRLASGWCHCRLRAGAVFVSITLTHRGSGWVRILWAGAVAVILRCARSLRCMQWLRCARWLRRA